MQTLTSINLRIKVRESALTSQLPQTWYMKVWEAQIIAIKDDNYYLQRALWCITGLRHNNQRTSCFTRPAKSISVTDFL